MVETMEGKNSQKKDNDYIKVLGRNLFDNLSNSEKEMFIKQIDSVEKDLEHKNTIKIRVRPLVIKLLCKMAGVHDIRGGAYRGDTVYVGHKSDLFNPQLLQHESIHVAQQKELGGFIVWLKKTLKDMKKYKGRHGDSPYIQYEASTLTPMELEAYTHQADENYLKYRKTFSHEKYSTIEGEQKAFNKILDRNTNEIRDSLKKKGIVARNVEHDLRKLEEITEKTNNTDRTMWVFNSVDRVMELEAINSLLKKKLDLLDGKFYSKSYLDKFNKEKEKYSWEINNQNLNRIFDDSFIDRKEILEIISNLSKDIESYRRQPTRFWLEPKKSNKDEDIKVEIPVKIK